MGLDRGKAVFDERGTPIRIVGSHTDISDWKIREEEVRKCATTDSLPMHITGYMVLTFWPGRCKCL